MSCCYLIGAGDFEGAELLCPQAGDMVIAADGGFSVLRKMNITPNMVLGDFDSLSASEPDPHTGSWQVLTFPAEKNYTDMMLAAEQGYAKGYRRFLIFGGTGGRMDHTLANIQMVVNLTRRGCRASLIGKDYTVTAVYNGRIRFPADCAGYFSVYSFSDTSLEVCEKGFRYEIDHFTLKNDDPRGISNEFDGRPGEISVGDGTLLICMEGHHEF